MTTWQYLAAIVGLVVCVWPFLPAVVAWLAGRATGQPAVAYREAILHLSEVRNRLRSTDALGEDQKRAIDILTLALVDGSDK